MRDYEREVAKLVKRNLKAFYRYANGKLKTRVEVADLRSEHGSTITNDSEKAEMFNKFFSSVYTKEDLQCLPDVVTNIGGCHLSTTDITEPDVLNLLRKLKSDKSPGPWT